VGGRRRRLAAAGPVAWAFTAYWLLMAVMAVGEFLHREPLTSVVVAALAVALVVRTARIGVWVDERGIRCVSWFVTRHVARDQVEGVEAVGYSGFGNEFRDSRYWAVLQVRRTDERPITLRGVVARASRLRGVARAIATAAGVPSREVAQAPARRSPSGPPRHRAGHGVR
jgi:hypothetical protein